MKYKYLKSVNEFFENIFNEKELMEFAQNVLKGFGYKNLNLKNLGDSGANGNAFLTSDNKVLKITKDASEAINADNISKMSNLKHFIKYFKVKRVDIPDDIFKKLAFALIMEKINPLKQDLDVVSSLLGFYRCKHHKDGMNTDNGLAPKYFNYNLESYEEFIKNNSEERLKETFGEKPNFETYKKYYNYLNEMMKEAKQHKIIMGDIDTGNLGFNSAGNFITFDIGGIGNAFNSDGSRMSRDQRNQAAKEFEVIKPEINKAVAEKIKIYFEKLSN